MGMVAKKTSVEKSPSTGIPQNQQNNPLTTEERLGDHRDEVMKERESCHSRGGKSDEEKWQEGKNGRRGGRRKLKNTTRLVIPVIDEGKEYKTREGRGRNGFGKQRVAVWIA